MQDAKNGRTVFRRESIQNPIIVDLKHSGINKRRRQKELTDYRDAGSGRKSHFFTKNKKVNTFSDIFKYSAQLSKVESILKF